VKANKWVYHVTARPNMLKKAMVVLMAGIFLAELFVQMQKNHKNAMLKVSIGGGENHYKSLAGLFCRIFLLL
ncbi:MAG TPA: hypothetical protein PK715_02795, partial [Chitinophagales bacterium]|nr:hypothetical protein [Chitinophagales bacterium]